MSPAAVREGAVEANGLRLRYLDGGQGPSLVHLQTARDWRFTRAHEALALHFRIVVAEVPDGGEAAARAVITLATTLGVGPFNLLGSRAAAEAALRLALVAPDRVETLILEAPFPAAADGLSRREDDLMAQLGRLAVPTLVVRGTRDGAGDVTALYAERIPNCHLVFVYDAGPAISEDRPEAFAEVVADFAERRDAFVVSRTQTVIYP